MPATATAFLVGSAGVVGLLPLGDFWCFGLLVEGFRQLAPAFAGVFLLTNLLAAANVTRVYRSVFLGPPLPKTERAPEANWLMALPMVSLAVIVLLASDDVNASIQVPGIAAFSLPVAAAVAGSAVIGVVLGSLTPLDAFWPRSRRPSVRQSAGLVATTFTRLSVYRRTVVTLVASLSWVHPFVVRRHGGERRW